MSLEVAVTPERSPSPDTSESRVNVPPERWNALAPAPETASVTTLLPVTENDVPTVNAAVMPSGRVSWLATTSLPAPVLTDVVPLVKTALLTAVTAAGSSRRVTAVPVPATVRVANETGPVNPPAEPT